LAQGVGNAKGNALPPPKQGRGKPPIISATRKDTALNAAEMAYLGDAVFELMVRDMLLREGVPFRIISRSTREYVSAPAQAAMYHKIFPELSQEEQGVMKRGRNLHSFSRAKNAGVLEYRHATGLEALFGWLYQSGDKSRLEAVFEMCVAPDKQGEI